MKKPVIISLAALIGIFFSFLPQAQALQVSNYPSFFNIGAATSTSLTGLVSTLFTFLLTIAGLAAFVMVVVGGIKYLTSAGSPSSTGDAKDQITSALLGLVIIFASWMILNTINPELVDLQEPGTTNLQDPKKQEYAVGACAKDKTYGVEIFSKKDYKPDSRFLCFNDTKYEQPKKMSSDVFSIKINVPDIAVKLFDEEGFTGKNICFSSSYDDIGTCFINCDFFRCDNTWEDDVRSFKVVSADECPLLKMGKTFQEDGITIRDSQEKCPGF